MALSPEEHAEHVDIILRGSNLTPEAQTSLRIVLADQKLCAEACLAMFQHLAAAGTGDWSAQWDFINEKLKSVGYIGLSQDSRRQADQGWDVRPPLARQWRRCCSREASVRCQHTGLL